MPAKLTNNIPMIVNRMHTAAVILNHRAANSNVEIAKQLAPVATGELRDSIRKDVEFTGIAIQNTATGKFAKKTADVRALVIARHGRFVEMGSDHEWGSIPAHPYLLPAFDSAVSQHAAEAPLVVQRVLKGQSIPVVLAPSSQRTVIREKDE